MGVFDLFKPDAPGSSNRSNFDVLIRDLLCDDPALRQEAKNTINTLGNQALVPLVRQALLADEKNQARIFQAIHELPGVSPSDLYACMKNTCHMDNREIVQLLAIPGRNAVPAILKLATDKDPAVRSVAVTTLTRIGEPALPVLTLALTHRSYRVRSAAAEALSRLKWSPKSNEEYLQFLIAGEQWPELIRAKKISVLPLIELLNDKYYGIRRDAAKALGETGDPRAVNPLIGLLSDSEGEVSFSAIDALKKINSQTAISSLATALGHPSYNVRHMAATALSASGWSPNTTEEKARFFLASEQWAELTRMGKPALPYLVQTLGDSYQGVRAGAATTLRGMGKPGMEALVAALNHPDPVVRKMVADTISTHNAPPRNAGPVQKDSPVAPFSSQGKPAAGNAGSSSHNNPGETRKMPEQQCPEISPKQPESRQPDTFARPDPVPRPSSQEAPKNREFTMPASSGASASSSHERQPDVSALARNTADHNNTDEEIASLILALKNEDENIRTLAVDALGRIGNPAIDALGGALKDASAGVRLAAAEILGRIGNEKAVPYLTESLNDADEEVRTAAARSLGEIGDFSAFMPLIQALKDTNPLVQQAAEHALAAFGDQATGPIRKLTTHENPRMRGSAAAILGRPGGEGVIPDLVAMFTDPENYVRGRAAVALGNLASPAIPVLAGILRNGDPSMRLCAVIGFGHTGPDGTEYLLLAVRDENPVVRQRAQAFLDAGNKTAMPAPEPETTVPAPSPAVPQATAQDFGAAGPQALIPLLAHPDKDLQIRAARDLVSLGAGAVDTLIDALDHDSSEVQISAAETLVAIGQPAIDPLIAALACPRLRTRIWAAQILGKIGDRRAVPHLVGQLDVEEPNVRQTISEALGYIGDPDAIPPLSRLLEDPAEDVQISAARALGYIGHEQAVPGLISALTDEEYSVRSVVANALIEIGSPGVPHLVSALCHSAREVRTGAAACLDQLNWESEHEPDRVNYLMAKEAWIELSRMGEAALPPLRNALASSDEDLRMGAILTLVKMESSCAIEPLIHALKDKNFLIRRKAMNALVDRGESARTPLIDASSSADPDFRSVSEQILERISRKSNA